MGPAFRNANRLFDNLSAATRLDDRASRANEFAKIVDEIRQRQQTAVGFAGLKSIALGKGERGAKIGDILLGMLLPAIEKIQNANDRVRQEQRNLHVTFALAAYRADNGRYPAKLDDLTPKYLPKVPDDMFSGKPLVYRPGENGYLLYSVGINGIDEEGRSTTDKPRGDDLPVRMPVPEPPVK